MICSLKVTCGFWLQKHYQNLTLSYKNLKNGFLPLVVIATTSSKSVLTVTNNFSPKFTSRSKNLLRSTSKIITEKYIKKCEITTEKYKCCCKEMKINAKISDYFYTKIKKKHVKVNIFSFHLKLFYRFYGFVLTRKCLRMFEITEGTKRTPLFRKSLLYF